MIVENKEKRVVYFDVPGKTAEKGITPLSETAFTFMPGLNEVDNKLWEVISQDSTIREKIKSRQFVVVSKDATKLENLSEEESVGMIAEVFDLGKLQQLAKSKKAAVSEAAKKQLDKIENYKGPAGAAELPDNAYKPTNKPLGSDTPVGT